MQSHLDRVVKEYHANNTTSHNVTCKSPFSSVHFQQMKRICQKRKHTSRYDLYSCYRSTISGVV